MSVETKKKPAPVKKLTPVEILLEAFENHTKITAAILHDYVADNDLVMELQTADINFRQILEDWEDEEDFDDLVTKLKDLSASKICAADLCELCDEDDVKEWVKANCDSDRISIELSNMNDRMKLEEFLKTHIYPNFSDQQSFIDGL